MDIDYVDDGRIQRVWNPNESTNRKLHATEVRCICAAANRAYLCSLNVLHVLYVR